MQSTEQVNSDPGPSSDSPNVTNGDSNANLPNVIKSSSTESNGAIPKVMPIKKNRSSNVITPKLNNNDEIVENTMFIENGDLIKLNHSTLKCDKKSGYSSDEEELLSFSDDGCIYMYKGDQDADLPISFFSLDLPPDTFHADYQRSNCSPEMDYLEMDFEPESEERLELREEIICEVVDEIKNVQKTENFIVNESSNNNLQKTVDKSKEDDKMQEDKCRKCDNVKLELVKVNGTNKSTLETVKMPWSCSLNERTTSNAEDLCLIRKLHLNDGELVKSNQLNHSGQSTPSPLFENTTIQSNLIKADSAMIWSLNEAKLQHISQMGPSACGATAVLNTLNALKFFVLKETITSAIGTRLRKNSAPLAEYLLSRSNAGTTHQDIIDCIHKVTDGKVFARFFHFYPERFVNLKAWLKFWIRGGAVPIATFNLQKVNQGDTVADAWHHQMIFGVDKDGIYLTNPLEHIQDDKLWPQLTSESILLIRREDVLSRWDISKDLLELMSINDERWRCLNVVGQVAHIVGQSRREVKSGCKNTSHIKIPASYSSGITIAIPTSSSTCKFLRQCPELPVYETSLSNSQ